MSCSPRTAEEKSFTERGRSQRAGIWMVLPGGSPQPGQAHIDELALADVGLYWVLSVLGALQR